MVTVVVLVKYHAVTHYVNKELKILKKIMTTIITIQLYQAALLLTMRTVSIALYLYY